MIQLQIQLGEVDGDYLKQLEYALTFAAEDVNSYRIDRDSKVLSVDLSDGSEIRLVESKIKKLIARYAQREFGLKSVIHFENKRELPKIDAWQELLDRKLITMVGPGHVITRGLAARLMGLIDYKVSKVFAREFNAETEVYPTSIQCSTLDRCNHFSSFPEHMNFVANLRQDVDTLQEFAQSCKNDAWSTELHQGNMANIDFALSPSCCYHCYEGMEGWELEYPGRCTTMTLDCHRFEGANMSTLSRLGSFTMREVVWIGHPEYVKASRARADELIVEWAMDWELGCTLENANDMFFTDDYAVKASFQRQQEAKKELLVTIPQENQSISIYSSNFHSVTFGKAFNISVKGRPATSGCVGWGLHRWVYAIFSQFGFEPDNWPAGLQRDFEEFCSLSSEIGWCK